LIITTGSLLIYLTPLLYYLVVTGWFYLDYFGHRKR